MQYKTYFKKASALCILAACSMQMNAQYLEHIYDYIENTAIYEENQEEGHAYYLADDLNSYSCL